MWRDLLHQRVDLICVGGKTNGERAARGPSVLLPGSFNPLHAGHREIARIASARLGRATAYELSIANVDKPPLGEREIENRLSQFAAEEAVWLTRAATFLEKARLFPGATFVVGADTMTRISDLRYYENSQLLLQDTIGEFTELRCEFLVFGRVLRGEFRGLAQLQIDEGLLAICSEVSEASFRLDLSSTQFRKDHEETGNKQIWQSPSTRDET